MTVQEFLQNYGGNECVSIEGYCEEKHYDYIFPKTLLIRLAVKRSKGSILSREADEWELSDDKVELWIDLEE